ncbi:MAG: hypothetical protein LBP67_06620 [Bacteroidales bacterium]|jgi:hypothetical protein|nr:hypothetical protein [Bacteroidales bacterium]
MIFNHGCCIGSMMWSGGYWIINSEDELNEVVKSLYDRANSINERAKAIIENWENIH